MPTYAFQHEHYWQEDVRTSTDSPDTWGLAGTGHPVLGAAVHLADEEGVLLSGTLSTRTCPWLADHKVGGTILLPGTAFVELAIRAGDEVGCGHVDELTLESPLVIPEGPGGSGGSVTVQVRVGAPGNDGRRTLSVSSQTEARGEWTRHADGVLSPDTSEGTFEFRTWPPENAETIELTDFYGQLTEAGYGYGPAFQGLTAAWHKDGHLYAEVRLADDASADAEGYGIHPALLDATLHAGLVSSDLREGVRLPFIWSGVSLFAAGASAVRVQLSPQGTDALSLRIADLSGRPIAAVDRLLTRPAIAQHLKRAALAARQDALFRLGWTPATAGEPVAEDDWTLLDASSPVPGAGKLAGKPFAVLVLDPTGGAELKEGVRTVAAQVLGAVQSWLSDDGNADSRLVLVTRNAFTALPQDAAPDPVHGALWGLVRSAQTENPDRFVLLDVDADTDLARILPQALGTGEPELAARAGELLTPHVAALTEGGALVPPAEPHWRVDVSAPGTLDNLALQPAPEKAAPLAPHEIRVSVRASGLNFRDVLLALDMYPERTDMGGEAAGVVTEVGTGVTSLAPGDRVTGVVPSSLGTTVITDVRAMVRVPDDMTFVQAAAIPVAYLTAYYGLVDVAGLGAGESVLVHSAAGGVGMAAVQVARWRGAEVFGTASEGKWDALRASGFDEA
ncbi:polyketide synthase dehydratase domain-containing protein, partial [Streptomyces sp. NPDC058045]|uniref:polyketide synthase dehydratase domain-containing protein n=1 Tax=Streptomyces sp. NPDC058045 TaxID=3346311 RepID=UPI0036EAFF04